MSTPIASRRIWRGSLTQDNTIPAASKSKTRTPGDLWGRVLPWAVPLVILAVWQWLSLRGTIAPQVLPSPIGVVKAGVLLAHTELAADIAISAKRAFTGFAIGGSLGFVFGLINGLIRRSEQTLDSTIQMARTIPHLALIPLLILWFGIGEETKIVLVALGVFFPIYLNTFHGMRAVDPALVEAGRVYGIKGFRLFRQVILPAALPSILIGLRFALGSMWLTLIVAETVAADSGIGYMTTNAREYMQTDIVVFGILLYALLGKGADLAARLLERVLLPWHTGYGRAGK
ncbi:MAG: ssuC [Capsulimonas sp.]|jgi:sulfonate transport system permease protein|nr:ssuC [Capsulimonas sp.]